MVWTEHKEPAPEMSGQLGGTVRSWPTGSPREVEGFCRVIGCEVFEGGTPAWESPSMSSFQEEPERDRL